MDPLTVETGVSNPQSKTSVHVSRVSDGDPVTTRLTRTRPGGRERLEVKGLDYFVVTNTSTQLVNLKLNVLKGIRP